jgi:hypothetical protein
MLQTLEEYSTPQRADKVIAIGRDDAQFLSDIEISLFFIV